MKLVINEACRYSPHMGLDGLTLPVMRLSIIVWPGWYRQTDHSLIYINVPAIDVLMVP